MADRCRCDEALFLGECPEHPDANKVTRQPLRPSGGDKPDIVERCRENQKHCLTDDEAREWGQAAAEITRLRELQRRGGPLGWVVFGVGPESLHPRYFVAQGALWSTREEAEECAEFMRRTDSSVRFTYTVEPIGFCPSPEEASPVGEAEEVAQLRGVIDDLCELAFEGADLYGGDFQENMESAGILVTVPAGIHVLGEFGSSEMLVQRWRTIREHETIDVPGEEIVCRWCAAPYEGKESPCIQRLPTGDYADLFDEGYRWDAISAEWISPEEEVAPTPTGPETPEDGDA